MIKQLFEMGDAVRRQVAAPLASSRIAFLKHCAEWGARPSTLGSVARTLVAVAQYLGLGEQGSVRLTELEAAAERWVCQDPGAAWRQSRDGAPAVSAVWDRLAAICRLSGSCCGPGPASR